MLIEEANRLERIILFTLFFSEVFIEKEIELTSCLEKGKGPGQLIVNAFSGSLPGTPPPTPGWGYAPLATTRPPPQVEQILHMTAFSAVAL